MKTKEYCTYIWKDPKSGIIRYVGKGLTPRPWAHLMPSTNSRLSRMLLKRQREGFECKPIIIKAASNADACEMEILLIEMLGREIDGGPLFNVSKGGDGASWTPSAEWKKQRSELSKKQMSDLTRRKRIAESLKKSAAARAGWDLKFKQCTVDGVTIYSSQGELIKALGQGKAGLRSPNFRYINKGIK